MNLRTTYSKKLIAAIALRQVCGRIYTPFYSTVMCKPGKTGLSDYKQGPKASKRTLDSVRGTLIPRRGLVQTNPKKCWKTSKSKQKLRLYSVA